MDDRPRRGYTTITRVNGLGAWDDNRSSNNNDDVIIIIIIIIVII